MDRTLMHFSRSHSLKLVPAIQAFFCLLFISISIPAYAQTSEGFQQAKIYLNAAQTAFNHQNYKDALTAIAKVENILGKSNPRLSALKVKIYVAQRRFKEAKKESGVFFRFNPKNNLKQEMSSYVLKIDQGITNQRKQAEAARLARIKREKEAKAAAARKAKAAKAAAIQYQKKLRTSLIPQAEREVKYAEEDFAEATAEHLRSNSCYKEGLRRINTSKYCHSLSKKKNRSYCIIRALEQRKGLKIGCRNERRDAYDEKNQTTAKVSKRKKTLKKLKAQLKPSPSASTSQRTNAPTKKTTARSTSSYKLAWHHTFGGSQSDEGKGVTRTKDGGFLLVGSTRSKGAGKTDIWAVKIDAKGNKQWDRTYGGTDYDSGSHVIQTRKGGYLLVGYTSSWGRDESDMWALRLDANGYQKWSRTFGGPESDSLSHAMQTSDGGFIMAGTTRSKGAGKADMLAMKIDAQGKRQWSHTYGGAGLDWADHIIASQKGGALILGRTASKGAGGLDMWAVKIDAKGTKEWDRTFGGPKDDWGQQAARTADGGFILLGTTKSVRAGKGDMYAVKINSMGQSQWARSYGGKLNNSGNSITAMTDGGFFLAGRRQTKDGYYLWAAKINNTGGLLWNRLYGGKNNFDTANASVAIPGGGILIVGATKSYGAGSSDLWALRLMPSTK